MKIGKVKQAECEDESVEYLKSSTGCLSVHEGKIGPPIKKTQIGFVRERPKKRKRSVAARTRQTR
jgi:hypothetical protein